MDFDDKSFLATLPDLPGVYRMLDKDGGILYVGKAKSLKRRVASYFQKNLSSLRIAHMVGQINQIETTVTRSEGEALLLESNLIKSLAPRYNILFRDDKSYPYILISKEKYPRLGFFRGKPDRKANYFGPFPSAGAVRESLQLIQKTFQLRTCENSTFENRSRPCLLHQIKRCTGACVAHISPADYAEDVHHAELFLQGKQQEVAERLALNMEKASQSLAFEQAAAYRDQIRALRRIQEKQFVTTSKLENMDILVAVQDGQGRFCVNLAMVRGGQHLGDRPMMPSHAQQAGPEEVLEAFIQQHYALHPAPPKLLVSHRLNEEEEILSWLSQSVEYPVSIVEVRQAAYRSWIEMAQQNALLALSSAAQSQTNQALRLKALQSALNLEEPIERIECFDISHTQGEATVASCVVYQNGGMRKSEYRRFNIRGVQAGDDYAAMHQALVRRYEKLATGEGVCPSLLLIDGGAGQVSRAVDALTELGIHLVVVGVAKGEGRKPGLESLVFPEHSQRPPLQLPAESPALHLVQEIRDEAHRFAITGHRQQRSKARKSSSLEEIPGIGPVRRRALIAHFGGLSGILGATVEDLAVVHGMSKELAEIVYHSLRR